METPKVSILVPIYKVAAFIEKCARSLFEQTFDSLEYIFVNDCTPDDSIEILRRVIAEYPHRQNQIKIIHHEHNTGIAAVRNTLLENASGEYIIFVDSDDWVDIKMAEEMYEKAIETGADIIAADYYLDSPGGPYYQHDSYSTDTLTNLKKLILQEIVPILWKYCVKRDLYISNKIHFAKGINAAEDYIVGIQLFYYAGDRFSILPKAYYYYAQYNPNNYSKLSKQNIQDRILAVSQVESFLQEKGILQKVKKELEGKKFIVKKAFLLDDEYQDFSRWSHTFPEANYAWRQFHFRIDYRIIFWLAEHHAFKCLMLIKRLKEFFIKQR